ncbi:hypothetical protein K435DRAFT_971065 [Dendrothele bispora CBS 962.96]|uniref:Cyclin-like domain-containing protein n=1 Tax=Dendrothele bispora (strain CBS 962.96) TaxID=1314807 RepID=A0A4S8L7J4_DENBC|nr:hypothetical protein K435DRAFT_971065 [Dendrothele bispora CBS 962.96]
MHPASLVDRSLHSPAILDLVDTKLSKPIIEYVVDCVADTVDYAMGRPPVRGRQASRRPELAKFTNFVNTVLTRAEVTTPVVLASLVYIDRAKPHLHIALEEWALERVFLGSLIIASKYLNDSTLKNIHWALCTGVFGKRDVGRIEREFLDVLDWELSVSEQDILVHHADISAIVYAHNHPYAHASPSSSSSSPSSSSSRPSASHHHHHHHRSSSSASSSASSPASSASSSSSSSSSSSPSRHHPYSPYRSRNHHRSSVPELEPSSSPISSDDDMSSSPQTPESSPDYSSSSSSSASSYSKSRKGSAAPAVAVAPTTHSVGAKRTTTTAGNGFHDLLRSFPIPSAAHHSHHHSHRHHTQTQFPIRV